MTPSVAGGPIAMLAIMVISLILVGILFLLGALIAYKQERNKTSFTLLSGFSLVVTGSIIFFITTIVMYNNYWKPTNITGAFMSLSLLLLSLGLVMAAISFIVYVKKHNKLLKAVDATNGRPLSKALSL